MHNNAGRVIFRDVFIYFILAFILCFATVLFVTFYSYTTIYNQAIEESAASIRSALKSERQRVSSIISSYATWNLSFQNIVVNYTPSWVEENVVEDLKRNFSIYSVGIYSDAGDMSVLQASEESFGEKGKLVPRDIAQLITSFRADLASHKSHSLFAQIGDQFYLLAVARINGQALTSSATKSGAFIVIAKKLNEAYFNDLSANYNITNITFLPADRVSQLNNAPSILIDQGDRALGYLTWSPRDSARQILIVLVPMGFGLIIILCLIGVMIARQILKAANGYQGMINDLTLSVSNMAKSKHQSDQTILRKEQMLDLMGNEVCLPVSGLISVINMLKDTELSEAQAAYVNTMESSSESLLKLVDSVLDFSKVEAGEISVSFGDVNIRNMIDEIFSLLMPVALQKNLKFQRFFSDNVPLIIKTDGIRLRQVIMHLVTNALKFTKVGSVKINVTAVDLPNNRCELGIQVVDTGIGIPEGLKEIMFDDFFTSDSKSLKVKEKLGLGLTTVKQLINTMQGKVGVETKLGQGSVFWVRIEVESCIKFERNHSQKALKKQLSELSILVVDENNSDQSLTQNLLERAGSSVFEAKSETEATQLLKTNHYDAVFISAAHQNDLARGLRLAMSEELKIPLVAIINGESQDPSEIELFDHVIQSPITTKKLENFLGQIQQNMLA